MTTGKPVDTAPGLSTRHHPGKRGKAPAGIFGIYVHLPFCRRKCPYCSFYSVVGGRGYGKRYLRALYLQVEALATLPWLDGRSCATIFFGGGTPTVIDPESLNELLCLIRTRFSCDPDAEISIEVNPATVDEAGLRELRRGGFNRISIGLQSLDRRELHQLGRIHSASQGSATALSARAAGFSRISLDLIYGIPGQSISTWRATLDRALELAPDHLSLYELTLEKETPYFDLVRSNRLSMPGEEDVLAMLSLAVEKTAAAGLQRYEIANYARPGHECRHNLNYWRNGSYLGLGAAAVSCLSGRRLSSVADIELFCSRLEAGDDAWEHEERLDREAHFRETVILGLRMTRGIDFSTLHERFGFHVPDYYGELLHRLRDLQLLSVDGNSMRLTNRGMRLANAVMAELV